MQKIVIEINSDGRFTIDPVHEGEIKTVESVDEVLEHVKSLLPKQEPKAVAESEEERE